MSEPWYFRVGHREVEIDNVLYKRRFADFQWRENDVTPVDEPLNKALHVIEDLDYVATRLKHEIEDLQNQE